MESTRLGTVTAHNVLLEVFRANKAIETLWAVIYFECENWIDKINGSHITSSALKEAIRQDERPRRFVEVSRAAFLNGYLLKLQNDLTGNELLGITSRVRTHQGRNMHIPMMDFQCVISQVNLRTLSELLPAAGQKAGFILESGRSYHFYGKELLSHTEWPKFLGKCLLMKNYVDERYVGHQLVDGHCVLRISASPLKPTMPSLVCTLEQDHRSDGNQ